MSPWEAVLRAAVKILIVWWPVTLAVAWIAGQGLLEEYKEWRSEKR